MISVSIAHRAYLCGGRPTLSAPASPLAVAGSDSDRASAPYLGFMYPTLMFGGP
jgi:hypothetical protein